MNVLLHGVTQGGVDLALARDVVVAAELFANEEDAEMATAPRRAGVPRMPRTFIMYFQVLGCECLS